MLLARIENASLPQSTLRKFQHEAALVGATADAGAVFKCSVQSKLVPYARVAKGRGSRACKCKFHALRDSFTVC